MPVNFLTALLTSFIGTLGFAVLLHTPQRAWIPGSCIGAVGYTLYWALMVWAGPAGDRGDFHRLGGGFGCWRSMPPGG